RAVASDDDVSIDAVLLERRDDRSTLVVWVLAVVARVRAQLVERDDLDCVNARALVDAHHHALETRCAATRCAAVARLQRRCSGPAQRVRSPSTCPKSHASLALMRSPQRAQITAPVRTNRSRYARLA